MSVEMQPDAGYRVESSEVFYTSDGVAFAGAGDIAFLKARAANNARGRARLCFHQAPDAAVHEMLIVHHRACYVRPHRHKTNSESLQVIEGTARAVFFSDDGSVERTVTMSGVAGSSRSYYRIPPCVWHSLLIESEWLVFMEVTQGPFSRENTEFALWAPDGTDEDAVRRYRSDLTVRSGANVLT
jgi:cupin fold WbuC family metalloprotein